MRSKTLGQGLKEEQLLLAGQRSYGLPCAAHGMQEQPQTKDCCQHYTNLLVPLLFVLGAVTRDT